MRQPPVAQARLVLRDVEHAYATRTAVQGISFSVRPGQTVALVGPSGCGKTTLLRLCAGLATLQGGTLTNRFAHTVMLFQQARLLPWKTVQDNIALGLKARGLPARQRRRVAQDMGLRLGLDALALAQYPHQLSGGMQSRAALARALVLQPDLLLLDEPFSALDVGLRTSMHALLIAQQQARALGVLLITHDLMEAMTLADTVLVLGGAPGQLVYRAELALSAARRSESWAYAQTAALLAQPVVRQAFELPPLDDARGDAAGASATQPQAGMTGQVLAAVHRKAQEHGC